MELERGKYHKIFTTDGNEYFYFGGFVDDDTVFGDYIYVDQAHNHTSCIKFNKTFLKDSRFMNVNFAEVISKKEFLHAAKTVARGLKKRHNRED
ncbi:MAG: hypothetical protein Unbinned4388contig1000_40 [Prokaryotic dsDNA virus sp.]|nr:MAG: hypothetical protein Unbinned4388contig1000_40 [Prokaryotic dsDNA virus sp.]|tara:strand:- start:60004 stop:60285 length:282 start_codon:yes stop_codon:yes gene_type:complete